MKDKQEEKSQDNKGYTKLPNEYLEAKAMVRLHSVADRVLCVIERKTFGWHKTWDVISRRQFREATGLSNWEVSRGLGILETMRMVEVKRRGQGKGTAYKVQMDFSRWKNLTVAVRQVLEKNHLSPMVSQVEKKPKHDGTGESSHLTATVSQPLVGTGESNKRKVTKEKEKEKKETNIKKKEVPPYSLTEEEKKRLKDAQKKGHTMPPCIQKALNRED